MLSGLSVVVLPVMPGVVAGNLGQEIEAEVWQQLDWFAKRTYVAATDASRRGRGRRIDGVSD